jgi:hypothetical protein
MAYPNTPGSKGGGASKDAADAMQSRAETLRSDISVLMQKGYRLTADEIAARMNETVLAIRPRVSELVKQNILVKTGERRKNISGMTAHVLKHWSSQTAVELPAIEVRPTKSAALGIQQIGRGHRTKGTTAAPVIHADQNALFA